MRDLAWPAEKHLLPYPCHVPMSAPDTTQVLADSIYIHSLHVPRECQSSSDTTQRVCCGHHLQHTQTGPIHMQVARERQACITIQAAWRGRQLRQRLAACHLAAARIQASFRACQQRQAYLQLRLAAIHVQVCRLVAPCMARMSTVLDAKHSYIRACVATRWHICHHNMVHGWALWQPKRA